MLVNANLTYLPSERSELLCLALAWPLGRPLSNRLLKRQTNPFNQTVVRITADRVSKSQRLAMVVFEKQKIVGKFKARQ